MKKMEVHKNNGEVTVNCKMCGNQFNRSQTQNSSTCITCKMELEKIKTSLQKTEEAYNNVSYLHY
jgi:hypothetical protein